MEFLRLLLQVPIIFCNKLFKEPPQRSPIRIQASTSQSFYQQRPSRVRSRYHRANNSTWVIVHLICSLSAFGELVACLNYSFDAPRKNYCVPLFLVIIQAAHFLIRRLYPLKNWCNKSSTWTRIYELFPSTGNH